ncbi:MAG: hypothetical protein ACI4JJ_03905 [Huintestinicola sp.]
MKRMQFRYFITDKTNVGSLIIGGINPNEMFLLLSKFAVNNFSKSEIIDFFADDFNFFIEAEDIGFVQLNTDEHYPYTYYNLVNERVADKYGYLYANISEIRNCFTDNDCITMLNSIDLFNFKKSYFS